MPSIPCMANHVEGLRETKAKSIYKTPEAD
jgi:hypothetical protein